MSKISDFRSQISDGFTLIELLVTITVLGVMFSTATALFLRTFRAGGKSNSIVAIEQNAQITLRIMDRLIKGALSVDSACPGTGSSLTITNRDGAQTVLGLVTDANGVSRIASNSSEISSPDVNVDALSFSCTKTEGVPEEIDISFTLRYASDEEGALTTSTFQAKSGLRTY